MGVCVLHLVLLYEVAYSGVRERSAVLWVLCYGVHGLWVAVWDGGVFDCICVC